MAAFQFARAARGGEASTSCSNPVSSPMSSPMSLSIVACRRRRRRTTNRSCCCPSSSHRSRSLGGGRRLVVVAVSPSAATPSSSSAAAAAAAAAAPSSSGSAAAIAASAAATAATPTPTPTATTSAAAAALPTLPLAVILEPPSTSSQVLQTGGDGDGGFPPSGGGGGGGDNEGDDDDGERRRSSGFSRLNPFAALAAGVSARCRADPEFAYKLLVECGLDLSIILGVNLAARGGRFLSELEFVLSQAAVSLLNDFALVYLLAPTATATAATAATGIRGAHSAFTARGSLAAALSALPAHVFQSGPFTARARLACLAARAAQYGAVGLAMGCSGSAIVRALVAAREAADAAYEPPPTEQGVVDTGLAWCYFMAVSSNLRYNVINGIEEWAYARARLGAGGGGVGGVVSSSLSSSSSAASPLLFATPAAARSLSVALRLANNVFGAHSFIQLAKVLKLDKPRERRKKRTEDKKVTKADAKGEPSWWKRPRAVVA